MSGRLGLAIALLAAFICLDAAAADTPRVLGVATCGGSVCHDATEPAPNASVAQTEFRTWSTTDPHAKAWRTLTTEASAQIAQLAGVGAPTAAPLCLSCHTAARAGAPTGPRFTQQEGVSCEACHGPAEIWIGPHARGLYHYDEVLAAGLYPTASVAARTAQCLQCHGPGAGVDHHLVAAGHPTPRFDAAAYSRLQPAHFVVDRDYRQRKRPATEATLWAVGASGVLAARYRLLGKPDMAGLFPEPALFACDSCHVPISDAPPPRARADWTPREIIDLSELPALLAVGASVAPDATANLEARARAVRAALSDRARFPGAARALADAADAYARAIGEAGIGGSQASAALTTLLVRTPAPRGGDPAAFALRALARTTLEANTLSSSDSRALVAALEGLASAPGRVPNGQADDDARQAAAAMRFARGSQQ